MAKGNNLNSVTKLHVYTRVNSESILNVEIFGQFKKEILQDIWHPIYFITI